MKTLTLEVARGFRQRLKGLLGRSRIEPGHGLLISPCDGGFVTVT